MTVVVVGGATMDLHARAAAAIVPGTSNPGTTTASPGGVGRNVAENLARLGTPTALVSVVGEDAFGDEVLARTAAAGVGTTWVARHGRTGTYTAILDEDGDLVVAAADMAATDEMRPSLVEAAAGAIADAPIVVVEGNLPAAVLTRAVELAGGARVVVDPVSVPKARRVAGVLDGAFLVTPNRAELAALTDLPTDAGLDRAVDALHAAGVELVWVRLGAAGSVLSGPVGRHRLAALPGVVRNVTGAGDAMLAAFCHAVLGGADPVEAARYGQAAAALTCASDETVCPDLSDRRVRSLL